MLENLAAQLARIADAAEKGAQGGPTEDGPARAALQALAARVVELEKGSDAQLLKRIVALEVELDATKRQLRSVRGKVYRDEEFHTPKAQAQEQVPAFMIGGPEGLPMED